jgi:type IV secretory pathway VirB10-like protein
MNSAIAAEPVAHSRLPFFIILLAILVTSGVSAAVVFTLVERQRTATIITQVAAHPQIAAHPQVAAPAVDPNPDPSAPPPASEDDVEPAVAVSEPRMASNSKASHARKRRKARHAKSSRAAVAGSQSSETTAAEPTESVAAKAAYGNLQVSTVPPVKILRGNSPVGQTFKLRSAAGNLVFGSGRDPKSDPFVVRIRYTVQGGDINYAVDSEPWAIVKNASGIGLGRTPLPPQSGAKRTVFEFINPKEKLTMRITLRYVR